MGKKLEIKDGFGLKGFFRVQIEEDGRIVGDSDWMENQVTNLGIQNYVAYALLGNAGSTPTVAAAALGTGAAPASDAITLPGEITGSTKRQTALTTAFSSRSTSNGSATAQWVFTFNSSQSFLAGASVLQNIGLYNGTTTGNTLLCGNTYTTSSCNTNQNVNCTYQIRIG
jgi:hypothetical protein